MSCTEITKNIIQIADDDGVYCTLVRGESSALLFDTGFGRQPLRDLVESLVDTGYMVVNSHCHPDHVSGNGQFGTVYAGGAEVAAINEVYRNFTGKKPDFRVKTLNIGQVIDLGGVEVRVVSLAGHTVGSIGLLIESERLLLAGDALNPCLWMFTPESGSVSQLTDTIDSAMELPFDRYIYGHSDHPLPKAFLGTIRKNAASLTIDPASRQEIMGIECYQCTCSDENGESVIVFRKDQI